MIDNISSYSVKNFIPFGDEVYFRLFERHFEKWWPMHPLILALGFVILVLAWMGKPRALAVTLVVPIVFCAVTFHFQLYAELTPLGKYFGWAYLVQAVLILLWGFVAKPFEKFRPTIPAIIGAALAIFGLAVFPFLALSAERKLLGAEYFGMSPDPTICFVLGIFLMSKRPLWFLLLYPIPFLWATASAGTIDALEAPMAMVLPVVCAIAFVVAIVWKWLLPKDLKKQLLVDEQGDDDSLT